jgi:hypothetical protein
MPHRPPADVRLGDLRHLDGGHGSRRDADPLERVLQREGVDDRGQHAHVVAGGAVEAELAGREAAEDVAAADHQRDLYAHLVDALDLFRDRLDDAEVDAVIARPAKRLTAQLQEDAVVLRRSVDHQPEM